MDSAFPLFTSCPFVSLTIRFIEITFPRGAFQTPSLSCDVGIPIDPKITRKGSKLSFWKGGDHVAATIDIAIIIMDIAVISFQGQISIAENNSLIAVMNLDRGFSIILYPISSATEIRKMRPMFILAAVMTIWQMMKMPQMTLR